MPNIFIEKLAVRAILAHESRLNLFRRRVNLASFFFTEGL